MRRFLSLLFLALAGPLGSAAAQTGVPVVVELFTSQGCNSCPPADAYLGELAKRSDVIALWLHVDYWDYIGWKDPFAQRAHTERQRSYSRALSQRYVYTPQMVVNGKYEGVGSDRAAIDKLIARAQRERDPGPSLTVSGAGSIRKVRIDGGSASRAAVWLAVFESRNETAVKTGENSGRRLANYNIIRELRRLGDWHGRPVELPLDLSNVPPACDGAAILVQANDTGPILAALRLDLRR